MSFTDELMGVGFSDFKSVLLAGGLESAITATGSAIGDAYDLSKPFNVVATTASSTGVQLTEGLKGRLVAIKNNGAQTLSVYPHSATATIDGGSAGAAKSVATTKIGLFYCDPGTDAWFSFGVALA